SSRNGWKRRRRSPCSPTSAPTTPRACCSPDPGPSSPKRASRTAPRGGPERSGLDGPLSLHDLLRPEQAEHGLGLVDAPAAHPLQRLGQREHESLQELALVR